MAALAINPADNPLRLAGQLQRAREAADEAGQKYLDVAFGATKDPGVLARALASYQHATAELEKLEADAGRLNALHAKSRTASARATFEAATPRREAIAKEVRDALAGEAALLRQLVAAQRALADLVSEDGQLASEQTAAVQSARLGLDVPARLLGLGLLGLNFDMLLRGLEQDLAVVKGRKQ